MSTASAYKRHALGLPAGSVRSLHVLLVVALFCIVLLIPPKDPNKPVPLPPYILYLMFIILGHFFAHQSAEGHGSPLHLPRGLIRLLVILALGAAIGWKLYSDAGGMQTQFEASVDELKKQPLLPVIILGGFFLGILLRLAVGGDHAPWFQDVKAWTSIVALVGLGIAVIIHSVINPSLENPVSMPHWEGILGAVIAFYFGERS